MVGARTNRPRALRLLYCCKGLFSPLYLQTTGRREILPLPEKFLFFPEMLSEGEGALVSPCRKEGIKALPNIFFHCHVKAVCDLLDGACNAAVQLVGIVQASLFTAGRQMPPRRIPLLGSRSLTTRGEPAFGGEEMRCNNLL